jgi:Methylase involved in ubiquinone/menaquinone biosynthesis
MKAGSSPGYVFADDGERGATHHAAMLAVLTQMLDPFTTWRLSRHVTPTSRCLEVAAGSGSVAGWLAEHAAEVTATDTDPTHVAAVAAKYRNLTVRRHDLVTDPLEEGRWDVIHVRLLLAHLPNRHELVGKLAAALAPGGVLVIDEFQPSWDWCVLDAPDRVAARRLFAAYHEALLAVLAAAGNDTTFGRNVHRTMRDHGLVDVDVELWAKSWSGGQAGCQLPYLAAAQLGPKLIEAGMAAEEIDAFRRLLQDPQLLIHSNLAVSTVGRRPVAAVAAGEE